MIALTAPLAVWGILAVMYLSILLAALSRRLSAVTKRVYHRRLFTMASGLIALAAASQVVRASAQLAPEKAWPTLLEPWFALLSYHVPLLAGTTITLALVVRYWGWILGEQIK